MLDPVGTGAGEWVWLCAGAGAGARAGRADGCRPAGLAGLTVGTAAGTVPRADVAAGAGAPEWVCRPDAEVPGTAAWVRPVMRTGAA